MRIAYITQTRFPTEKAHGHQVAQVCSALAALGHEVTLLAPTVWNAIQEPPHSYYGVPPTFAVVHPGTFDALGSRFVPGKLGFAVGMWSYGRVLRRTMRRSSFDLLYARSPALLRPLLKTGVPLILELHTLPRLRSPGFSRRCNRCLKIVCLTTLMRDELARRGVLREKIVVEGDGVDLARFARPRTPQQARHEWALPLQEPVAAYVGSLVTRGTIEKGIGQFLGALAALKRDGIAVFGWIVGGPDEWRFRYLQQAGRLGLTPQEVLFQGAIPAARVPSAIAAADVCVYPAPASDHPFFRRDTSPLKLFEYLAAGKPIVCADLPPIRDIVDGTTVYFCPPGDAQGMAQGIRDTLAHPEEARRRAAKGKERAAEHSWTERMKRILRGLA